MFVVLLGAGLIVHQVYYVVWNGWEHMTRCFAPALGVRVPAPAFAVLQYGAVPVVVVLLWSGERAGVMCALVALGLWAAVQSLRVSNHVWLALLGLVLAVCTAPSQHPDAARLLLAVLYLTAGVVKCNRPFLFSEQSTARYLLRRQFGVAGRQAPGWLLAAAPPVTAAAETAAGLLLFLDVGVERVLYACLMLHLLFGIVGNFHFSLIVLAFWYVALGDRLTPLQAAQEHGVVILAAALLGAVIGLVSGNVRLFHPGPAGVALDSVLCATYCAAATATWTSLAAPPPAAQGWAAGPGVMAALFLVNMALLVAGIKGEWSFAMFSDVRPFGDARVLGIAPRWRTAYFKVCGPGGGSLPPVLARAVPRDVRLQVAACRSLVSAPVARQLLDLARRTGTRIEIIPQGNGIRTRRPSDPVTVIPQGGPLWTAPVVAPGPKAAHLG